MIITSMLIWGSIGIFRRYIPLSSAILACFRGISGAAFLCLIVALKSGRKKKRDGKAPADAGADEAREEEARQEVARQDEDSGKASKNIGFEKRAILALNGALIGLNWILLFEAYNYTTVPIATLCYYMQPTIVILLSPVIFREKLTKKKGICALIAIIGMFFVSGIIGSGSGMSAVTGDGLKGIIFGLGAAALYSTVVIINKKLPAIDAYEKTIIQLFSAAIVLIPYLAVSQDFSELKVLVNPVVLAMLLIVGIVHTGIAYALYFGSVDGLKAQSIAILSYLDPISALILSAIILHEAMTVTGIIGAVLILGAAFVSEIG